MRKFYTITSPEQFDTIHFVQGDTFKYDCLNCGQHVTIMRFDKRDIDKYKRMFCRRCNIRYTRHSNDTSKIIEITDPKQFDNIKSRQLFKFNCKRCGNTVIINEDYFRPQDKEYWKEMLCGKCRRDIKRYEQTGFYTTAEVKTHKETPIEIKSVEELKSLKNRQSFFYYCIECGAKVEMPYGRWRPSSINRLKKYTSLLCGKCSFDLLGDKSNFGTDSYKSKFIEKYGIDNPMKDPEFKENCFKSREINHGSRNWTNPEKAIETFKANHNGMTPSEYQQTEEYRQQCIARNQRLYGHDWLFQSETFRRMQPYGKRLFFDNTRFDSIPELALYVYCKDFGIPIVRNEEIYFTFTDSKQRVNRVYPDFIVNGQLVEVKGAHFFREDGTMFCPYRYPDWTDERYEYECELYRLKHECEVNNGVLILVDTSIYMRQCIDYLYTKFTKSYISQLNKRSSEFIGKGYTPYNMDKSKEYQDPIGRALGPYDINNN